MSRKRLFSVFIITAVVSLLIAFDVSPFLRGPAPYPPENRWEYIFVNTLNKIWAPILIFISAIYIYKKSILQLDRKEFNSQIYLLKLILIGTLLNVSILFYSRSGVGVLFRRVVLPQINGQFETAIKTTNFLGYLNNLEKLIPVLPLHSNTHPPGIVGFYYLIDKLVCFAPIDVLRFLPKPNNTGAELFEGLSMCQRSTAYLISFLSLVIPWLVVVPIFHILKLVSDEKTAVMGAFLYLFVPSIILFVPIPDTYYGLFSMSAFYIFVAAFKTRSRYMFLLSGLVFSAGLLFSFSIIPILIIFYLFSILSLLNKEISLKRFMESMIYFTCALLTIPGLLLLFDINYFRLYKIVSIYIAHRSYLPWLFYNLYDFFILLGIPYFLIFIFSSLRNLSKSGRIKSFQWKLNVGILIMVILLDVSGFVRAETSRIWLPFVPFIIILISGMFSNKMSFKRFFAITSIQFIFLLLIQEFWAVQS